MNDFKLGQKVRFIGATQEKTTSKMSWEEWGLYFGYPDCCIKSFSTLDHVGKPPRKLDGTGYIPCPICNEKPEDELIAQINFRRHHTTPFKNVPLPT